MLGYLAAHPEPGQGVVRALSLALGRALGHPAASRFVKVGHGVGLLLTKQSNSGRQRAGSELLFYHGYFGTLVLIGEGGVGGCGGGAGANMTAKCLFVCPFVMVHIQFYRVG